MPYNGRRVGLRTFAILALLILSTVSVACTQNQPTPDEAVERYNTMSMEEQSGPDNQANRERSAGCIPIELYDASSEVTVIPDGVVCEGTTSNP